MKKIHFIINPVAGNASSKVDDLFLLKHFDKKSYTIKIKKSQFKKHAISLTKASIEENPDIIVACGGDGTVNEVASCLVNTKITLGIIPLGSGNGLASNLKIPKNIEEAITIIKGKHKDTIDVGCINTDYFFSNTGFGFDAAVIKNYEAYGNHKLYCYLKALVKSFSTYTKNERFQVSINNKEVISNPFLIFISNSNEMGYNISLTPRASLQDGLLDIVIIPKISKFKMVLLGVLILIKRIELLKEVRCFQSKEIMFMKSRGINFDSQIDGEAVKLENSQVTIRVQQNALTILT